MKKFLFLFCMLHFFNLQMYAQDDEQLIIGITDFLYDEGDGVNRKFAGSIGNNVFDAFAESKLFTLVDRTKLDVINKELERNKEEWHLISDFLVEQGKRLGASHLLVGEIEFIRFEESLLKSDDLPLLKATVDLNFNIVDVETGKITETVTMDFGSSPLEIGAQDSSAAILKLKDNIKEKTNKFIYEQWPQKFSFIKMENEGKKLTQQATFYMKGGHDNSLKPGYRFKVLKVEELDLGDGNIETVEKEVGEAVIDQVNSGQVSLCKVVSGKKDLLESVEKGETLICQRIY